MSPNMFGLMDHAYGAGVVSASRVTYSRPVPRSASSSAFMSCALVSYGIGRVCRSAPSPPLEPAASWYFHPIRKTPPTPAHFAQPVVARVEMTWTAWRGRSASSKPSRGPASYLASDETRHVVFESESASPKRSCANTLLGSSCSKSVNSSLTSGRVLRARRADVRLDLSDLSRRARSRCRRGRARRRGPCASIATLVPNASPAARDASVSCCRIVHPITPSARTRTRARAASVPGAPTTIVSPEMATLEPNSSPSSREKTAASSEISRVHALSPPAWPASRT